MRYTNPRLLYLLYFTVYNRTITRYIADDNVVYQRVRWEIRLASDNSWARHHSSMWAGDHGELFFCIHLNREWQFHAKSNEVTDAFLACSADWPQGPPLLHDKRGLTLPRCRTTVSVFWLLFNRLSMLPSFQPLSGNSANSLHAPHCFDWKKFFIRITSCYESFMILFNFCWYLGLDNFLR